MLPKPQSLRASTVKHWRNCQHCYRLDTEENPLLICVCKHARYCNKECQKADWRIHKPICMQNRATSATASASNQLRIGEVDMLELSKKWVQIRKGLLGQTAVNALDLHTHPERIDTHIFMLSITPTFDTSKPQKLDKEIAVAFEVEHMFVCSIEELLESSSANSKMKEMVTASLKSVQEKAEALKKQTKGVLGVAVTQILIKGTSLTRLIPWAVQHPLPPQIQNWEEVLKTALANPRVMVQFVQE